MPEVLIVLWVLFLVWAVFAVIYYGFVRPTRRGNAARRAAKAGE